MKVTRPMIQRGVRAYYDGGPHYDPRAMVEHILRRALNDDVSPVRIPGQTDIYDHLEPDGLDVPPLRGADPLRAQRGG